MKTDADKADANGIYFIGKTYLYFSHFVYLVCIEYRPNTIFPILYPSENLKGIRYAFFKTRKKNCSSAVDRAAIDRKEPGS